MEIPSERRRLFYALLPDDRVQDEIVRASERLKASQHPKGKWSPVDRLHMTLVFLGDFPALATDVVVHALAAGDEVDASGFDLTLDSAASFSGRHPPWVLRCDRSRDGLLPFWRALGTALAAAGFRTPPENDFVPHVTVLRDADKALEPMDIKPIHWPVQDFALMHSRLGQQREYVTLRRWALRGIGTGH